MIKLGSGIPYEFYRSGAMHAHTIYTYDCRVGLAPHLSEKTRHFFDVSILVGSFVGHWAAGQIKQAETRMLRCVPVLSSDVPCRLRQRLCLRLSIARRTVAGRCRDHIAGLQTLE